MTASLNRLTVPWLGLRGWVSERSRVRGLSELCAEIRALCMREGIDEEDVVALVAEDRAKVGEVRRTIAQMLAGEPPRDIAMVASVAERLEERYGVRLDVDALATPAARLGSLAARASGGVLGVSCLYLVVGGLLEGQSERFAGLSGPVALLFFFGALAFLGLFEALHTSVTQLRLADLRGLSASRPRACSLHRRFRDERGISRVLAGRQIVVVITVFVVAGLSSFPEMRFWPLTESTLPGPVRALVELGLPGALVVLWLAQLAPQYYATRHAVALMDTRAAAWALDLAFALEGIGIAGPSRWLFKGEGETERIPTSPALQWEQAAADVDGDGLLSQVRRWECDAEGSRLRAVATTTVHRDGHATLTDSSLILPGSPSSLSMSADILDATGLVRVASMTDYAEDTLPSGELRLRQPVVPAVGSFAAGDRVQVAVDATYGASVMRDAVHVERRPRHLLWRLDLSAQPLRIGPVRVRVLRVGDGSEEPVPVGGEIAVEPELGEDGLPSFSYALAFPSPNTLFVFEWEVLWR